MADIADRTLVDVFGALALIHPRTVIALTSVDRRFRALANAPEVWRCIDVGRLLSSKLFSSTGGPALADFHRVHDEHIRFCELFTGSMPCDFACVHFISRMPNLRRLKVNVRTPTDIGMLAELAHLEALHLSILGDGRIAPSAVKINVRTLRLTIVGVYQNPNDLMAMFPKLTRLRVDAHVAIAAPLRLAAASSLVSLELNEMPLVPVEMPRLKHVGFTVRPGHARWMADLCPNIVSAKVLASEFARPDEESIVTALWDVEHCPGMRTIAISRAVLFALWWDTKHRTMPPHITAIVGYVDDDRIPVTVSEIRMGLHTSNDAAVKSALSCRRIVPPGIEMDPGDVCETDNIPTIYIHVTRTRPAWFLRNAAWNTFVGYIRNVRYEIASYCLVLHDQP